jgi:hypothetical protein
MVDVRQLGHGQGKGRSLRSFGVFRGMTGLVKSRGFDLDDMHNRFLPAAERLWKQSCFDVDFHPVNDRAQV